MLISTPNSLTAFVYMDYENIQELLSQYGKCPLEINFFPVILEKFKKDKIKVVDFFVYNNFEKKPSNPKQQTYMRALGLQTRHSSNNGKNSSDLELTVDALRSLYKIPGIDLYILITSDRDIIPLLKAIRAEKRLSRVLSTRNGFNQTVAGYADFHEYLEDIFGLDPCAIPPAPEKQNPFDLGPAFNLSVHREADIDRAREVARLFYNSHIWRKANQFNEPVNLTGYTQAIAKILSRQSGDILESFKLAHALKYITIYSGPNQKLFIKEGAKKADFT